MMPRSDDEIKTIAGLERTLGPAEKFILTDDNWQTVRTWAVLSGYLAGQAVASGSALANLYHQHGPKAKPAIDPMTALLKSLHETGYAPINRDLVGQIAREMFDVEGLIESRLAENEDRWLDAVAKAIDARVLPGAPIVVHVQGPNGLVKLEGLQHEATPEVIQVASLNHPIMMVGPAGAGKTFIGEAVSKALALPFFITSTVFDTHELLGFTDGMGNYHRTAFRDAFEHGGVWVADEIDAWDAAALLSINSALANGMVTFPDSRQPVKRHANFRMISTANTFGKGADRVYVGRNELDAASLDRYAVIEIDYDAALESHLCRGNIDWYMFVTNTRRRVLEKNIRHVVSMRAITMGADALAIGMKRERVEEIYVFKGMSETDRKKLLQ